MATERAQLPTQIVLVYSDNSIVRAAIQRAITPSPAADLATIVVKEFATADALKEYLNDRGRADLIIVDGEAAPVGGLGLAREIKDEVYGAPAIIGAIGREADRWLATWARLDGIVLHPIDPRSLAREVAALLRKPADTVSAPATH
jgi:DNA-binding response OmpR family regulator